MREIPFEQKAIEPQYLMDADTFTAWSNLAHGMKLAFMDVTSATNARTMISTVLGDVPCGNSAPVLWLNGHPIDKTLLLSAFLNSLSFDFTTRLRTGGLHLNWFVVDECPLPRMEDQRKGRTERLTINSARLTFLHRSFALEWLMLKSQFPALAGKGMEALVGRD